jgi:CRP/FNR family transcriptional regulator
VEAVQKIISSYHVRKFEKGELILCQGEIPECAMVIKSGVVKTYNLTAQGEEKPIGFDVQNEVFPVSWIFSKSERAIYYYEAFTDCELYCVPRQEYVAILKRNPELMFDAFDHYVSHGLDYQMRVNALEQSKAALKVLNTIHFLCLRYGVEVGEHQVRIQLPLTQQDLANFMGLTRETTGIELKKLQRAGILTYKKQNYIVLTDKLDELLDEDYDAGRLDRGKLVVGI